MLSTVWHEHSVSTFHITVMTLCAGVVQAAASILAVEAYHAGIVRDRLVDKRTAVPPTGLNLTVEMIVAAISNLRDSVDGPSDDDQSITIGDAVRFTLYRSSCACACHRLHSIACRIYQ
jgi:hypothetical protein